MPLTQESLGFMLAIDNCGRGCSHCPAHGLGNKMETAPFDALDERLKIARKSLEAVGVVSARTIHAWRIGDLLDYRDTSSGEERTVADLAEIWNSSLGQPLYTVTNGSMGSVWRRNALTNLVSQPDLSSQVKLTVTPFDPRFSKDKYIENMAHDVAALWPLASLPSQRPESIGQPRFRINAKATPETHQELTEKLRRILQQSEVPIDIEGALAGEGDVLKIKPVYDLRVNEGQQAVIGAMALGGTLEQRLKPEEVRDRHQLGFRPNGDAFEVDLWAFKETNLYQPDSAPQTFDTWFPTTY